MPAHGVPSLRQGGQRALEGVSVERILLAKQHGAETSTHRQHLSEVQAIEQHTWRLILLYSRSTDLDSSTSVTSVSHRPSARTVFSALSRTTWHAPMTSTWVHIDGLATTKELKVEHCVTGGEAIVMRYAPRGGWSSPSAATKLAPKAHTYLALSRSLFLEQVQLTPCLCSGGSRWSQRLQSTNNVKRERQLTHSARLGGATAAPGFQIENSAELSSSRKTSNGLAQAYC